MAPSDGSSSASPGLPSRLSPLPPLPPLEYLQNQRRGSITDPSLHAAPPFRYDPDIDMPPDAAAPNSPYLAADHNHHHHHHHHHHHPGNTSPHLRNLLRSPSLDLPHPHRPLDALDPPSRSKLGFQQGRDPIHKLSSDTDRNGLPRTHMRDPLPFDYNMRRHSIATGQHLHPHPILPPVAHGIKRKLSMERSVFAPVGEEPDSQLVGPGVPSVMEVDPEPPAPKRRGSAIDTQRIAQLSLNDRRGSTDSRGPSVPWWTERRDSLSNPSSSGFSYSGRDSPHGRLPTSIAAFSWPGSQSSDPSTPTPNGTDPNTPNIPRQFDASPSNTIPPLNYPPDRRMSVPDTLISPSGAHENLRSRSRPPSRQSHFAEPVTRANSVQDSANAAGQHPGSSFGKKEMSATPYSRSPELRVSHKLAERKRRKEMKDLFDELRDQLPADRGMKASKWEILTKAIDFVVHLKQSHQDMVREIDRLRQELDIARGGSGSISSFQPPNPHVVYGQVPILSSQGPHLQPPLPGPSQLPLPRQSTQNTYPSITSSPPHPSPNGEFHRSDGTSP